MSAMSLWETVDTFERFSSVGGRRYPHKTYWMTTIGWWQQQGGNIFIPKERKEIKKDNFFLTHHISLFGPQQWFSISFFEGREWECYWNQNSKENFKIRQLVLSLAGQNTWDFKGVKLWSKRTWTYLSSPKGFVWSREFLKFFFWRECNKTRVC